MVITEKLVAMIFSDDPEFVRLAKTIIEGHWCFVYHARPPNKGSWNVNFHKNSTLSQKFDHLRRDLYKFHILDKLSTRNDR